MTTAADPTTDHPAGADTHPPIEHQEPSRVTTTSVPLSPTTDASDDPVHPQDVAPSSRAATDLRRTITPVLRSEWIKATSVRTTKVLLAVAAVTGLLISWAAAASDSSGTLTVAEAFIFPTVLTPVLAAVAGVLLLTAEVQHGTLAASLAAHPTRWPVAVAKVVAAAGSGLVLGAIGVVAGFAGALAGGLEVGDASSVLSTAGWGLLYTVGAALLGLGVGMVVRHSAGAVSGLLVWWLVVEGMVVSFAPPKVVRFVPFDAGSRTLDIETDLDRPDVVAAQLANALHASIFWAYVIAAVVIGTVLLIRRDAD